MQKVIEGIKGSCWTLIIFSSTVINFEHFPQTSTMALFKWFIKVQIWLVQILGFKVQSSWLSTINSNPPFVYVISSIWYSPLPFWLCSFAIVSSYYFTSEIQKLMFFVSDTHYFLAFHSVSSSLPQKAFLLMVASNFQMFYPSRLLRKLSYANVKESYSRRTTTVTVNITVLTKVLSFS